MTRIDFYLLRERDVLAMHRFACKLATQIISMGNHVYIHANTEEEAKQIDVLLWEYPSNRFIPHEMKSNSSKAPINIGWQESETEDDILINLTNDVLDYFGRFNRLAEIVVEDFKREGRERYKFYKDRGFPLFHHSLANWDR